MIPDSAVEPRRTPRGRVANPSIRLQEYAEYAEGFQPISLRSLRTPVKWFGRAGLIARLRENVCSSLQFAWLPAQSEYCSRTLAASGEDLSYPAAMRAGEGDGFELGEWHPNQFGLESLLRRGRGRDVNRLGDLKTRDAATLFREQCAPARTCVINAGVFRQRESVQQQRAVAFAPNASDGALLHRFGREPRVGFGLAALARRAIPTNRAGET
jgi:hypothetical protein